MLGNHNYFCGFWCLALGLGLVLGFKFLAWLGFGVSTRLKAPANGQYPDHGPKTAHSWSENCPPMGSFRTMWSENCPWMGSFRTMDRKLPTRGPKTAHLKKVLNPKGFLQ